MGERRRNEENLVTGQSKEAEFLLAQAQFMMLLGYRIPLPHTLYKCVIKFSVFDQVRIETQT